MSNKMRFTIRVKLAIMSMITIAVAVVTLGITLSISYSNAAYETAENTLESVNTNASLALSNSIASAETSMKLLANQIGYNHDFADSIITADQPESINNIRTAMAGKNNIGDGSTIIGAMDYLIVSDPDIESATMYSWFVTGPILSRLKPSSESKIPLTQERKDALLAHPGDSYWFFTEDNNLYVWKAIVNYGVTDTDNMQVVGYVEYGFLKNSFLECITDTKYENNGMYLLNEKGENVLGVSCDVENIDQEVSKILNDTPKGVKKYDNYTVCRSQIESKGWTYISYINHNSIKKTIRSSSNLIIIVVVASVLGAALVAYLLSGVNPNL